MTKLRFIHIKEKRSVVSCDECRRRKKGCDEKRPKCSACLKRNVDCTYNFGKKRDKMVKQNQQKIKLVNKTLLNEEIVTESDLQTTLPITTFSPTWFPETDLNFSATESTFCDLATDIDDNIPETTTLLKTLLLLDSDSIALNIIEDFNRNNRMKCSGRMNETFIKCYEFLSSLIYSSRPILLAFSSWILSLSIDSQIGLFFTFPGITGHM